MRDRKTDNSPGTSQEKPMKPAARPFPSKNLTPILPPPYVIQLYLPMRALYHPALFVTQSMFWGWKRFAWVCQIWN